MCQSSFARQLLYTIILSLILFMQNCWFIICHLYLFYAFTVRWYKECCPGSTPLLVPQKGLFLSRLFIWWWSLVYVVVMQEGTVTPSSRCWVRGPCECVYAVLQVVLCSSSPSFDKSLCKLISILFLFGFSYCMFKKKEKRRWRDRKSVV